MEDEEGYMALNFKLRNGQKGHRVQDASQHSRRHQIAAWIGWAGNIVLLVVVIVLVFQILQLRDILKKDSQGPTNETENMSCLDNVSHLRKSLCKPPYNHSTENRRCKICPQDWILHENKCYWISKRRQTWHKSKEDCTAKHSGMLAIKTQEEITFIQSVVEGSQLLWIGLTAIFPERKWAWVDGSPLDDQLLTELGPVEENFCGQLYGNKIISEACSAEITWICEREALLI